MLPELAFIKKYTELATCPSKAFAYRRGPKNYITRLISYQITLYFLVPRNIICTIRLLSCKYAPLTQGNDLNPNHDGSSSERDVPKQSSHVRV